MLSDWLAYLAPNDWISRSMPLYAILAMFAADLYTWSQYYTERQAVAHAHKKFAAHGISPAVYVHAAAGVAETLLGLAFLLDPVESRAGYAYAAALVAALLHVPSGFLLTPHVWGLKNITVTGYAFVGILRLYQAARVFLVDPRLGLPDLWILLHMATLVRLVGFFVTPYSSADGGRRGDLFTEPLVYTLYVSMAAFVTLSFVFPPVVGLAALFIFAAVEAATPTKLSAKLIPSFAEGEGRGKKGGSGTESEAAKSATKGA